MKVYPYIGRNKEGVEALIYSDSSAFLLSGMYSGEMHDVPVKNWFSRRYENITAEYLTNTCGKVESKEHAEFIIKLAENAGFTLNADYKIGDFFYVSTTKYGFASEGFCGHGGAKQITIPLPPKESEESVSKPTELKAIAAMRTVIDLGYTYHGGEMWKPPLGKVNKSDIETKLEKAAEMQKLNKAVSDPLKNSGDNLFFGGEDKCKEWPKVGDEVLICKDVNLLELHRFNGKQCKVIGVCEHNNVKVLTLIHKSCGLAAMNMGEWIKKPLTPEEVIRDELIDATIEKMSNKSHDISFNAYYLVSELMGKYDIQKKPQ